ncbi:hypothetical protein KCU81_g8570, partial [Aureobasidium melanogenum]|uniref:Uncharacterized protein n=1 Tax=Aureobasidium melanogenum (strain CBS 110374) TaxID=1043003 RepID=A0A074VZ06_AURM1
MDDTVLQKCLDQVKSYNSELMSTTILCELEFQSRGAEHDEATARHCTGLSERISTMIDISIDANKRQTENGKKMAHYIADQTIKAAVTRLATQIRLQPQNPMVTFVLDILSESPEGNDRRKKLEARIKAKMSLAILDAGDEGSEFAEKVQAFEKEAGELALEFAIKDAKKMADEGLGMLAMI